LDDKMGLEFSRDHRVSLLRVTILCLLAFALGDQRTTIAHIIR
jgi:hypothetical protein